MGNKGREFKAYSTRQKVVFNTSSVRRRVPRIVYSTLLKLRTNLSHMPPWCGALGGLNLHLMPLCASSVAMLSVIHFSTHSRSSFSAPMKNEVGTIIRPNHSRSTPTGDEPLHSHYTRTSVHGRDNFNMDSTSRETSEKKSPPLLGSPTNGDVEWDEVINPGVGKRRRLVCESLLWEFCHDRCNGGCTELSTQDAV